jgi:hypothetical protein
MHESLRQMLRLDAEGDSPRVMGFSFGIDGHGRNIGCVQITRISSRQDRALGRLSFNYP